MTSGPRAPVSNGLLLSPVRTLREARRASGGACIPAAVSVCGLEGVEIAPLRALAVLLEKNGGGEGDGAIDAGEGQRARESCERNTLDSILMGRRSSEARRGSIVELSVLWRRRWRAREHPCPERAAFARLQEYQRRPALQTWRGSSRTGQRMMETTYAKRSSLSRSLHRFAARVVPPPSRLDGRQEFHGSNGAAHASRLGPTLECRTHLGLVGELASLRAAQNQQMHS